jgi:hypothetical protein
VRRVAPLLLLLVVAGCGGGGDKVGAGTSPAPAIDKGVTATLASGTVQLRSTSSTRTAVTLALRSAPKGLTAELDTGSCGAKAGLQLETPLGKVTSRKQSWSVVASLTKLTAAPLAVVLRRGGEVADCGNVAQR